MIYGWSHGQPGPMAISKDQPHEAHHGEAPFSGPVEAAVASRCFHGILRRQVQGTGQGQPDPKGGFFRINDQPKINIETKINYRDL